MIVQPFPPTKEYKEIEDFVNGFVASFIFTIAMAFIPASLITIIVKEKEDLVKH